jgi:glyoxylase-like metal-dependent hydrolase (beta-lactamase superfamily II)
MKFEYLFASYFNFIITENHIPTYHSVSHYHAFHFRIFITGVPSNNIMIVYNRINETKQKQELLFPIRLNFQSNLVLTLLAVVGSSMLVTSVINSIDLIPQQQFVFAQEKINVSSYNKTSTNAIFPQIHNYTSSAPGPVNSWIVESKNGVVVIDTQRTLTEAKNLKDEVKKINKPILGVIITHPHPDHIGGTGVLLDGTGNVPIYATQAVFDIMKNDTGGLIALAKRFHGNDYADQVVLPDRIVNSGGNVTIDGIIYSLKDIGPGEAGDMTLIYLPSQKLLFTGDVVNNEMIPFLAEGRSIDWIKQLEYIIQNYSDAKVLFPGHGQSGPAKILLDKQLNYIDTFRSLVEQQLQSVAQVGEETSANITENGKINIKNELQRLYPNYIPVAKLPSNFDLNDLNINAIVKEIGQDN